MSPGSNIKGYNFPPVKETDIMFTSEKVLSVKDIIF